MIQKMGLFAGTAMTAVLIAQPAIAQDNQVSEATNSSPAIIVTGRKREEDLSDIPVSAIVLSGEQLENLVIFDSVDLIRNIPNAAIAYGGGPDYLNTVVIRGVGAGRGPGSEPATGLYRNGIYIGSGGYGGNQFSRMDLFDVARSESFRGPQGALFGRNAVGGAINMVTRRPGRNFGGNVSLAYNEWERAEIRAAIDIPVSDAFGVRLGGFYMDQNDGFIQNTFTGEAADQREDHGLRLTTAFTPDDNLSWVTIFEYYDRSSPSFAAFSYRPGQDPFSRPFNGPSQVDIETTTVSTELTGSLDFAEVTLTGLYREQQAFRTDDLDWFLNRAGGLLNWLASETSDIERFGVEFHVASIPGDDGIDWLFGIDHMWLGENVTTTNTTVRTTVNPFEETFESTAIFGALDFDLTDRLTVGGEVRATFDTKSLRQANSARNEEGNFDSVNPVVSLTYELADSTNLYARFATGFRAGGVNRNFPAVTPSANQYDVEDTVSYEAGLKTTFGGGMQLDLAAFVMETDGVQIVTRTPGQTATYIQNAGDARVYGLEGALRGGFELNDQGTRIAFDVGASVSRGKYTAGAAVPFGATAPVSVDGNDFPRLRDLTANATVSLAQPVTDSWDFFGQVNVVHESGGFEDTFNVDGLADFTIFDARVGFRSEHLDIMFVGKNLTNEAYVVENLGGGQIFTNRPRVLGVEVRGRF